jgi:hypothetical protein
VKISKTKEKKVERKKKKDLYKQKKIEAKKKKPILLYKI